MGDYEVAALMLHHANVKTVTCAFRMLILQALCTAILLGAAPALAQKKAAAEALKERSERYEKCIALAQTDAEASRREAAQWEAVGGGAQARHCAAVSLIAIGATREAAQILTEIGSDAKSGLGKEDRVSMLSLAGQLWLQVGQGPLARRCFDAALKFEPGHRRGLIGAAHAAASSGDHAAAEKYLNRLLKKKKEDAEALTFRASARRLQGKPGPALSDATEAAKLSPESAPAWFEKGAAERALGKKEAARESWIKAAMLDLVGQVGDDARHALAVLDSGR